MDDLKAWRKAQNPQISQANFAGLVGARQPHISAVERGEEPGSLGLCIRIYERTGVRVGVLAGKSPREIAALAKASSILEGER